MAGVSNNSKQWFEGISECISFSIILQVDDKQAKDTTWMYPLLWWSQNIISQAGKGVYSGICNRIRGNDTSSDLLPI